MISSAQRRLLLLTATFALSLLSCGREVTGPENGINYGRARFGAVSLDPQMPSLLASLEGAGDVVPFERVRVVLRRDDGTISVDTIVDFPAGAESISLSLLVPLPLDTPEEGLPLSLTMAYMNAAGDTVFRGGPVGVIAPPVGSSASQQPITIEVVYDGVGKDAARVAISPKTATRVAGTVSTFSATAFDGANAPIANTPIIYYTLDSSRASIPDAGTGQVTWLASRGVARIVAALPNGLRADTAVVTVALPASKLVVQSGDAQSAVVSSALPQPIVLRTLASDDVPVEGVIVTFAVATGSGSLSVATDTSDVNGVVSTNWTLGAPVGAQSITATSAGLTGSPLTLTATATAGVPAQVVFTQSVTAATAGTVLTPPVLVAVQDIAGNVVTTFAGPVGLQLTASSSGPVSGTTTVNAVAGVATFADLSFDVVGSYNLIAVLDSTARDTSEAIAVAPGAGARLEFVDQPSGSVAGVPFVPPVTVIAKDAKGNIATGFTGTVTLALLNPNGATLGGSLSVAAVNGLATFSGITVDRVGSAYELNATSGTLTADTSAVFGIVAASPASVVVIAGDGQTGAAGVALPSGVVVEVRDSFGNPIPSATMNFAVLLGGGTSSSTTVVTDALGRAATTWTLGPVVGAQSLRASVPGFPLATVDIGATATVGAPASVVIVQSPVTQQIAGVAFAPDVVVDVRDIAGNLVTNYSGPVTLAIANNPSGASLLGTLTRDAVNGVATFPSIFVQIAGVGFTLQATTDVLPAAISPAFDVVNAPASAVVPVAGDGQVALAGTLLTDSLVVRVTDEFGNKIAGVNVVFTIGVGGGSIAPSTVTTNALGEVTSGWTLGGTAGTQTVTAAIAGGANYQFSASATAGAPTALTLDTGDSQVAIAGSAYALPLRVRVADSFGNGIAGVQVAWSGIAATVASDTTLSDANGFAQVIATADVTVGIGNVTATLVPAPSQFVVFDLAIDAGAASAIVVEVQPVDGTSGTVLDPFAVRANDAFGNLATGFNGPVTLSAQLLNGTPVAVIVQGDSVNAVGGLASFVSARIDVAGTYRLVADFGALGTIVTDSIIVAPSGPSSLTLVDGDGQSGAVTTTLAAPLRVRVTDAFGNGVSGVNVNWGVTSGLAEFTDTVTVTDASGLAQTSVILGNASGVVSIGAFAAGLTGSPVGFSATATAGAAFGLLTVSGDAQSATAGAAFALPFVVRVVDAFGNGVSGVDVTFASLDGASAFGDTVVTSDASGLASTTATAANTAGSALITANASGVSPTSFSVTITAGVATELFYQSLPTVGTAGVVYDPIVIAARDAFGNVVTGFTDPVTISIRIGASGATLAGTLTRTPGAGIITFDDLVFTKLSSYQLEVVAGPLSQPSPGIQVNAAAAAAIASEGLPERTMAVTAVAPPLFAKVTDAFGNPVAGETVTWSVASGSITLSAPTSITDALGVATVEVTAGTTAGSATATASSGTLVGSPVAFPITITNGPGTQLTLEIAPTGGAAGSLLSPFTVAVRDANGNVAADFVGNVTIVVDSGPSPTVDGAIEAVVGGSATFDQVSFQTSGQYRLRFSSPGLTDVVSGLFTVTAGAATNIVLLDGNTQSSTVATALVAPLRVLVVDVFGNRVPGVTVNWAVGGGSAQFSDTVTVTNANGEAQTSVTLGNTSGGVLLTASSTGLTGSPVLFTATATAGAAFGLVTVSGDVQSATAGTAFALPFVVRVVDSFGNGVSGVDVTFSSIDGVSAFGDTVVTSDANGLASTTATASTTAGSALISANASGVSPTSFSVTITAGAAAGLTLPVFTLTGDAGQPYGNIEVQVNDAFGNVVTGFAGTATIAIGTGPGGATIGGTLTKGAVAGLITFDDLVFNTAGAYTLSITSGALPQVGGNITIAAGAAAILAADGAPERTGAAATTIVPSLSAKITDAFGNAVIGETVTWSVASGDITLSSPTSVTNALGLAAVDVIAGPTAGSASVTAASGALTGSPVTFPITVTNGPGTQLTLEIGPVDALAGDILTPFTVAVRDANGNVAENFVGDVTIVVDSGPSLVIGGVATVAVSTGAATFAQVSLETAGQYRLRFSSPGLTDTVSGLFNVLPGAAATLALLDGDAQSDTVGLGLDLPLRVRVLDSFGNGVPGRAVAWLATGSGAVALDTTITDASGIAQVAFTLGTVSGGTTMQASVDALVGSPIAFTATGIPGAVAALVVTTNPGTVSAIGVGGPIEVEAQDVYANLVTWFTGNVSVTLNDAPAANFAAGTTTRATVAGVATFDDLVYGTSGSWFIDFTSGAFTTGTSVEVVAGAPSSVTILSGNNQSGIVTLPLASPLQVIVRDANNNPVVGDTVVFSVTQGGGTLSSLTALDSAITNTAGVAQTLWTLGSDSTISHVVQANRTGFATLTFTATPLPFVANRTWTGDVDTDPTNAANWQGGLIPTATDSVLVPAGRPNYPSFALTTTYARLTVEPAATVTVPTARLEINGSLSVNGTITTPSTGEVALIGGTGGTVRGTIGRLVVESTNYTATAPLALGSLSITGGSKLTVNAQSIDISGNLDVNPAGSLVMNSGGSDLVTVNGNATFGAFATGPLLTGTLTVRGDFSAGDGFRPDPGHTVVLDGAGNQTVTLAVPDTSYSASCVTSCFGTLTSSKATGGLIFGSSIKALGAITISGDTLNAPGRKIIAGDGTSLQSSVTIAGQVGYTSSLTIGSQFFADTLVAFGGDGTTPVANVGGIPTVVSGSYALGSEFLGDLLVTGVLDIDGPDARTVGDLLTAGTGRIRMTDTNDSLSVSGAIFGGITDSTFLTAGVLEVRGNFTNLSSGTTSYAAQPGHRLRMSGAATIMSVTDPLLNPIGALHVNDGSSLTIDGIGVRINGTAVLEGTTATATSATAEALIFGGLVDAVGNRWSLLSTRFQGPNPTLPVAINGSVIFANAVTLGANLDVTGGVRVTTADGLLTLSGRSLRSAQFTTDDLGRLSMSTATDSLFVSGTAAFEGGVSVLTDGWLEVGGNFVQAVTSNAFAASPAHSTWLTGGSAASISFATPGLNAGQSYFGKLGFNKSVGLQINLLSDVGVNGVWETIPTGNVIVAGDGGERLLSTRGANVQDVAFTAARWELRDGAAVSTPIANVSFGTISPAVAQFRVARAGGTVQLSAITFATVPNVLGSYIEAQDTNVGDGDTLTVSVSSPLPAFHGGRINLSGSAKLLGWDAFAAINWTGAIDQNWFVSGNWAEGIVPTALDSVVVPAAGLPPVISGQPAQVRSLLSSNAQAIQVNDTLTVTRRLSVNRTSGMQCNVGGALVLASASDSVTVDGSFGCLAIARSGPVRLTGFTLVDSMRTEGTGYVNPANDTLRVVGDFLALGSSLLMIDAASTVEIGGTAAFLGSAIPGGMTAGNLILRGDFAQSGSADAFQAEGTHFTRFNGGVDQAVFFANPDSSALGSHFGTLFIESAVGAVSVNLASDIFVNGTLAASTGVQRTFANAAVGGATIISRGANVTQDLNLDGVRWRIVDGEFLASTLTNVRFVNQPEGITQLSIARTGGSVQLSGFQFDSLPAATTYLAVIDSDIGGGGTFTVDMLSPSPAFHNNRINVDVNALLTGWNAAASFIWTGAFDANWTSPANWSDNLVPNASSVVTIPDVATAPQTSSAASVRQLFLTGTTTVLSLGDTLFVTEALHAPTSSVSCVALGRLRFVPTDTADVRGTLNCPIDIISGVVVQSGNTSVTGDVTVGNVGRLAMGAFDMVLAPGSAFATGGSGTFELSDPSGSLTINGPSTFAGGATTGLLTSGQLTFNGNVTQGGGDAAALDIGTGVGTIFSPSASSLVSFTDPASSGLGTTVVTSGTMSIQNTTTVRGPLDVQTGATVDGESGRLSVNGDLSGNGALIVKSARFTGNWARSGALQPDTVIFAGVDQIIASTYSGPAIGWKSVVVEGTASATTSGAPTDTLTIGQSLIVRGAGARLTFDNTATPGDSLIASVVNGLRTLDGGTFAMTEPGVSVNVVGFAEFAGGDETGLLTDGLLTLQAGLRDTVTSAFNAGGAHQTVIGGCLACPVIPVQNTELASLQFSTVRFVNVPDATVTSRFFADTLVLDGGTVNVSDPGTPVWVTSEFRGANGSALNAAGLVLSGRFAYNGTFNVVNTVLTGPNQRIPAKQPDGDLIAWQNITVNGTAQTQMLDGDSLVVNGVIFVQGSLRFGETGVTSIARLNNLTTGGTGTIEIQDQTTTVRVLNSAFFDGGSTAGLLDAGTIEFYGDFSQTGANSPSAFSAGGSNFSRFVLGLASPVITFENPGATGSDSHFGHLWLVPGAGTIVGLGSDVFVTSQLLQDSPTPIEIRPNGALYRQLTSDGAAIDRVTFRGVNWIITGGTAVASSLTDLTFVDQNPAVTQFAIRRDGLLGNISLINPTFSTVPTSGKFLEVEDVLVDANVLTVDVTNPTPGFHNGLAVAINAILTGWSQNGPGIWTGIQDTDFNNPGNWQSGFVPSPTDSIYIDDSASQTLSISSPITIGALTITGGQIDLQDTLTVTGTASLGAGSAFCGIAGALRVAYPGADSVAFSMNSSQCNVYVSDGRVYLGQNTNLVNLFLEQDAILDVNGRTLTTLGDLVSLQTSVLVMTDNADTVRVGSQGRFQGGDATGLLTAGALIVQGTLLQGGATTAFATSGTLHVFLGDSTNIGPTQYSIDFNEPATSPINRLTIFDNRLAFGPVNVTGELRMAEGSTLTGLATTALGGFRLEGTTSTLSVDRLAVGGTLFVNDGAFAPDTVDFLGNGASAQLIPARSAAANQLAYTWMRVFGDSVAMEDLSPYRVDSAIVVLGNGLLVVGDPIAIEATYLVVADSATLRTEGNGALRQASGSTIRVKDALFGGGDLTARLPRGDLIVHNQFRQFNNGISTSFVAEGTHRVIMDGATPSIALDDPSTARLAGLRFRGASDITLLSDIFVRGSLEKETAPANNITVRSDLLGPAAPRVITILTGSLFASGSGTRTTFRNVALRAIADANLDGGSFNLADMSFEDMDPTSTYLDLQLENYIITASGMQFNTLATTGKYFDLPFATSTVTFLTSTPAVGCINAPEGCVGPRSEPSAPQINTWTGLTNDWTQGTNWSLGTVPASFDDVVIPVTGTDPVLGLDDAVRNLTVQSGATLTVLGATLNVNGTSLDVAGTIAQGGSSVLEVNPPGAPVTISGGGTIATQLIISAPSSGSETTVTLTDSLLVTNNLSITANTLVLGGHKLKVGDFFTQATGRLEMSNAADSLDANSVLFQGESTDGLLTAGKLVVRTDFLQGGTVATSFAANVGHQTIFTGGAVQQVTFANPLDTDSHFGTLRYLGAVGDSLILNSDVIAIGPLQAQGQRVVASSDIPGTNRILRVDGFDNSGAGQNYFFNVSLYARDSWGLTFTSSLFFANMSLNVPQLWLLGDGGTVNIAAATFTTLGLGDPGVYVQATDANLDANFFTVNMPFRSPEGHGGKIQFDNGAILTGWDAASLYTFTGTVDGDFTNLANWDVGVLPTATSNVLVDNALSGNALVINTPVTFKRLTTAVGSLLSVQDTVYTTGVLGGFDLVSGGKTCSVNGIFVVNDPSAGPTWLRADIPGCDLILRQGNVNLGNGFLPEADTTNVRDLRLEGGFFNTAKTVNVGGDLTMTGGGILFMGNASDSLVVLGDASFRGQQANLTGGNLLVRGNLDVGAAGPLQFRMESPSHLTLGNPAQALTTHDISIDPGSQMYLDSLTIQDGFTTVTGQLNVRRGLRQITSNTNTVNGETIVLGSKADDIVGTLTTDAGSQLAVKRFELFGNITSAGDFSPDTADFVGTSPSDNGGIQKIRSANDEDGNYGYKLVRVFDNAVMDQIPTGIPIAYTIATGLQVLGGQLTVGNAIDTAYVNMGSADLIVSGPLAGFNMTGLSRIIADSAHFQGGITSQLSEGRLVARSVVAEQQGFQNLTLNAADPHVLDIYGTGWLSMNDYANNPLSTVRLTGGAVTTLNTYLRIDGSLGRVADADGLVTLRAGTIPGFPQFIVTPSTNFSPSNSGLLLRNVAMSLQASYPEPGGSAILNNVTFTDMDPSSIFLQALWGGAGSATATWNNINFNSPVSTGRYFEFATGGAGSAITFTNASPAAGCLASTCLPSDVSPSIEAGATWTGTNSSSWTDASNWSTSTVPTASADVVIPNSTPFAPVISANTGVKSLTVDAGATLSLSGSQILSVYGDLAVDGVVAGGAIDATLRLVPPLDTATLRAPGAIQTRLAIGADIGAFDGVVQLTGRVNLTTANFNSGVYLDAGLLDLNSNTMSVAGSFLTFGNSRWKMVNALDTLIVLENFEIAGASTEGLLTDGEIDISGVYFRQYNDNSNKSFVATGNHTTRLSGGNQSMDVWFEGADSTLSRFQNLAIDRTIDQYLLLDYTKVFATNLTRLAGKIEVFNTEQGLGSDGELIVTGSVSNVDPLHSFELYYGGRVKLLGIDQVTCDGLSFNILFGEGLFLPTLCHSQVYAWTPEAGTAPVTNYAAFAASDTEMWTVGDNGTIQRGDGSTWVTDTSNTSSTLYAMHGTSATDVWAVGAAGTIVHWDGSSWSASTQGSETLRGVFAYSPSDVYAVGDNGTILQFDGTNWNSMTSGTTQSLTGIFDQGAPTALWVTGTNGTVLRLNGGSWIADDPGVNVSYRGTYSSADFGYLVVGDSGRMRVRYNFINPTFRSAGSPTTQDLYGVGGRGAIAFAVGANGTIVRLLGATTVLENSTINNALYGVAVTPTGTVYIVGAGGMILRGVLAP